MILQLCTFASSIRLTLMPAGGELSTSAYSCNGRSLAFVSWDVLYSRNVNLPLWFSSASSWWSCVVLVGLEGSWGWNLKLLLLEDGGVEGCWDLEIFPEILIFPFVPLPWSSESLHCLVQVRRAWAVSRPFGIPVLPTLSCTSVKLKADHPQRWSWIWSWCCSELVFC